MVSLGQSDIATARPPARLDARRIPRPRLPDIITGQRVALTSRAASPPRELGLVRAGNMWKPDMTAHTRTLWRLDVGASLDLY